jgi:uncharacterized protein YdaL
MLAAFSSCGEQKTGDATDQDAQGADQNPTPPPAPAPAPAPTPAPEPEPPAEAEGCVQVFYDGSQDPAQLGRSYALMIVNLIGHFPRYQSIIGPIELYSKGDFEKCDATFYVGMARETDLPADFLKEFKSTKKQAVWLGYNFWQLGEDFEKIFGFKSFELATLDKDTLTPPPDSKPGFFRDILYKGETFKKFNEWSDDSKKQLDGAFEVVKLSGKTSDAAKVLAEARHSVTGEVIPWALQNGNKFYVTEVPLSYFHEGDRYFVFTDLIFDFLKEKPRHDSKSAYIRLEDVGPIADLGFLQEAIDILKKYQVTPHINLYPVFKDPHNSTNMGVASLRMEDKSDFFNVIKKYHAEGTNFIWHGITHQYKAEKNPYSGASGDDYEFWNSVGNSPIAEDSVSYVLDLFDDGFKSLKLLNLSPKIWVTPHYQGSALDNVMFGQMFPWMVSRAVYLDNKITGLPARDTAIQWDAANAEASASARRKFFSELKVETAPGAKPFGQIFPYEIHGDIFRQRVIPENLGNVVPPQSAQVKFPRSVENMLADAKRNLVLRDVWAVGFYHPFLLNPAQNPVNAGPGPKDLEILVKGLKDLGYNFISLNDYAEKHREKPNKPRIELQEIR